MEKKMKMTLYHAEWCGHCVSFLPEWQRFKNESKTLFKNKVDVSDIESSNIKGDVTIAGKQLEGFPTVKVEFDGQEFEYKGKRTYAGLSDFVKNRIK
jgi:hypothetical protein